MARDLLVVWKYGSSISKGYQHQRVTYNIFVLDIQDVYSATEESLCFAWPALPLLASSPVTTLLGEVGKVDFTPSLGAKFR